MKETAAILCAGGPAPGINTVISSVTKAFLQEGYEVLGIHGGYGGIFQGEANFESLSFEYADNILTRGGSALRMSRYKPKDNEFTTDFFVQNNVKILITIGGDDTASTATRLANYLQQHNVNVKNIHVPKTIDNDLPLPEGIPTFGYQTAKEEGVRLATTVYEDARTSGNWFLVSAMGREAGHLAFGMGTASHFPMIIIPEMFNQTEIGLEPIVKMVISSMVKRKIMGIDYGAAVVSEGVFHFIKEEELKNSGINFTFDEHGHPELGNVSKAHIFNILVQARLKKEKVKIKSRPVELGYEFRCARPIAYDLKYATLLGTGVYTLFEQGHTGCMVTVDQMGKVTPLYLKDVADEKGKIKPRLVNIDSEQAQTVLRKNVQFLGPDDYEEASKYLNNPEEYDYLKILNW